MDIHKFGEILVQKSKERLKQNNNDEVKSGLFEYYNTYYLKNKNFYFTIIQVKSHKPRPMTHFPVHTL